MADRPYPLVIVSHIQIYNDTYTATAIPIYGYIIEFKFNTTNIHNSVSIEYV